MDDQGLSSSSFCMKHGRGGGGGGYGGGTKCGRWNPTTEQVKVLTELFRSGLRTPSTDQIQKISSQLSFYGKIESKNVFYWFQNHKARERQKRRRVSVSLVDDQQKENHFQHNNSNNNNNNSSSSSSSSSLRRHFVERNQVSEAGERVIETLQLFPLHSFNESSDSEKLRFLANDQFKETFSYSFGAEMDHPKLDLRLSSFL